MIGNPIYDNYDYEGFVYTFKTDEEIQYLFEDFQIWGIVSIYRYDDTCVGFRAKKAGEVTLTAIFKTVGDLMKTKRAVRVIRKI